MDGFPNVRSGRLYQVLVGYHNTKVLTKDKTSLVKVKHL